MRIEFVQDNSDHDGPVIDIFFGNEQEAFELGRVFQRICEKGKCVWRGTDGIRIPLVDMDNIGLAVTHNKSEGKRS